MLLLAAVQVFSPLFTILPRYFTKICGGEAYV